MKAFKLLLTLLLLGLAASGNAWADRGHARIGVFIDPFWGPWYYPPPSYYYPPVVIERTEPPVYIQQQDEFGDERAAAPDRYWYYCAARKGYYPYVKTCPSGWQQVAPRPSDLSEPSQDE